MREARYKVELILWVVDISLEKIRTCLCEFGQNVLIERIDNTENRRIKVQIDAEEPTLVFDICSQFGRIKSVRINEEGGARWQRL